MPCRGAITGYIDVAQVVLYAFWIFFAGLIFYLRREDKREGYPLEIERSGDVGGRASRSSPSPRPSCSPHGGTRLSPRATSATARRSTPKRPSPGPARRLARPAIRCSTASARLPTPMRVRYARPHHRRPRPRSCRCASPTDFIDRAARSRSARHDGGRRRRQVAGTVTDVWVDRSEIAGPLLEVDDRRAGKRVLLPMTLLADRQRRSGQVKVALDPVRPVRRRARARRAPTG